MRLSRERPNRGAATAGFRVEILDRLLDHGKIVPAQLTTDPALRERIAAQPMLAWKSLHVFRHKDDK